MSLLNVLAIRDHDQPRSELCQVILKAFHELWHSFECPDELAEAKSSLTQHFLSRSSRWTKDSKRNFKKQFDGEQIVVNASGCASLYVEKTGGTGKRLSLNGSRSLKEFAVAAKATGNDRVRTIHLKVLIVPSYYDPTNSVQCATSIDVRDFVGISLPWKSGKRSFSNPTFPGHVMLHKAVLNADNDQMDDIVELWKAETGLDFESRLPNPAMDACEECILRGVAYSNGPSKSPQSLSTHVNRYSGRYSSADYRFCLRRSPAKRSSYSS